jgi:hypothetical protein
MIVSKFDRKLLRTQDLEYHYIAGGISGLVELMHQDNYSKWHTLGTTCKLFHYMTIYILSLYHFHNITLGKSA